jgi:hypothetical protein
LPVEQEVFRRRIDVLCRRRKPEAGGLIGSQLFVVVDIVDSNAGAALSQNSIPQILDLLAIFEGPLQVPAIEWCVTLQAHLSLESALPGVDDSILDAAFVISDYDRLTGCPRVFPSLVTAAQ